ncbi:hypothetical protein V2E39_11975 [Chryseobacterium arthrosphaerae]|uniref:VCBS repeat-containing protein n=1 Tax=Chryseobacterium arthrosphaerae TaxID=651561 RepID=A0A1B8ZVL4_9FLAO|nr:hypothetical protein [Chryseobacterium arthrosphaerae]OCA75637.1 hypothetical protein BBI00_02595 [Chryseobacterium arthrosphaerae]
MKKLIIPIVLFSGSFMMGQEEKQEKILGDFDGNGTKEYVDAKVTDCSDECDGKCETTIYFSDKTIKPFTIAPAKGGAVYNLGDLNGDGKDDIGFFPNWCTSCWHPFYVYTLSKTGWKPLVPSIATHCNQWEADRFPIRKDPKKKGNVIITTSKWENEDIKVISKSVKVN